MERQCPRCPNTPLRPATGSLLEDVCPGCRGRFLDGDTTVRLFTEHLRITRETLHELSRDGPRRLVCPSCQHRMTLSLARGVQVDLCRGCGGAWLDEGELSTLSRGIVTELKAAPPSTSPGPSPSSALPGSLLDQARAAFGGGPPGLPVPAQADQGLELAREPRSRPSSMSGPSASDPSAASGPAPAAPFTTALVPDFTAPRAAMHITPGTRTAGVFEVRCLSCDEALDLGQTNWLINQRPWCARCAVPYTGLGGFFDTNTDTMKISPDVADRHFGPFFRAVR